MKTKDGLVVERIGMVGTTVGGEHIGIETQFEGGAIRTILIPFGLFQKLMLGLMASGAAAQGEQLGRLGSEDAVLAHNGFAAFSPTACDLGRGWSPDGADKVLLRFKQQKLPVIDIMLAFDHAARVAGDLAAEVRKGPAVRRKPQ